MKLLAYQHFNSHLNQLASHGSMDSQMFKSEVNVLAWAILYEIRCSVDMGRLYELHGNRDFPTLEGIREALRAIEADHRRKVDGVQQEKTQRLIAEIKSDIATFEAARFDVDTTVYVQRVLRQIESRLQALLEGYRVAHIVPKALHACVRRRVLMLGEGLIHNLWVSIREEIKEGREAGERKLSAEEFGKFPGTGRACTMIAAYMTTPRPERCLRVQRIIDRREPPPVELVAGLSIVLTWGDSLGVDCPTADQQMLAVHVQRLMSPLCKLTNTTMRDALSALGLRSLRMSEVTKYHFPTDETTPHAQQVFFILRDLIWHAYRVTAAKGATRRTRRDAQATRRWDKRSPRGQKRPAKGRRNAPWTFEVAAKSSSGNRSGLALRLKARLRK